MVADGYKQTEIGVIPEDWEVYTLPDITTYASDSIKIGPFGSALKKEILVKTGYKVYGQENIYENNMELGNRYLNQEHFNKLKTCEVKPKDFLISMMGTIGKCAIVPSGIEQGIIDSHLIRIRIDDSKFQTDLLLQLFKTSLIVNQIKQLTVGGIMEGLSSKIIKKLYFPIPPKQEQKAIATALSDTDALIDALEKLIAKKEAIKTGTMQQLLTGNKRLDGFSGEWVEKRLGELSIMFSGGTPSSKVSKYYNGKIKWVSISDMTKAGKYLKNTEKHITEIGLENSSAKIFKQNTLLLAMYASIGKCCIAINEVSTSQAILGISTKKPLLQEYLYYYLVFNQKHFINQGQQGTQSNLNKEMVQETLLNIPKDIEEQKAIATILSDMDKEIETLKSKLTKLKAIKEGMMQELLSGKTRLLGGEDE